MTDAADADDPGGTAGGPTTPRRIVVLAKPGDDEATRRFVDALDRRCLDVTVVLEQPQGEDEVAAVVDRAVADGASAVGLVGGDGTLNLVAQRLVGTGVAVAIGAAGTVNMVATVLGVAEADASAAAVADGEVVEIDVGECEAGVFALNASSGTDAGVIGDADDHSEARFGRLRFARAAIRRLWNDRPGRVEVRVDDRRFFAGRAMSVVVLNFAQRASSAFEMLDAAVPDDGLLDVAVVRAPSLRRNALVLWQRVRRREVADQDLVSTQGLRIDVAWASPVPTQRDGDVDEPRRTITYRVRPAALAIHAPGRARKNS